MGVAFGKYHLIASLGQGGMADVYLAAVRGPVGFRKLVVIKRLREDVATQVSYASMLLDEAQLAARLQHPNVVQTFEVGVQDARHYIAMEYLEGQAIARILRACRRPDPAFTTRVMGDALAGLHYAHDLADYDGRPLGIVHRDVSPQNLFVTYAGEVKVVDFGIAKINTKRSDETAAGVLKGKLSYMAPEQVNGEPADRRTDVFAAGIVMWEMLTGRRLFKAPNEGRVIAMILYEEIVPPSRVARGTPRELDAICLRALERDPARRWQTAGDMREALYRYMETGAGMRRDDAGKFVASLFERERADVRAQITEFMASAADELPAGPLESLGALHVTQTDPATSVLPGSVRGPLSSKDGRASASPPPMTPASGAGSGPPPPALPLPYPQASLAPAPAPTPKGRRWMLLVAGGLLLATAAAAIGIVSTKNAESRGASASADAGSVEADGAVALGARASSKAVLTLGGSGTVGTEAAPAFVESFFKKRGAATVKRTRGPRPEDSTVSATMPNGTVETITINSDGTSVGFACLVAKTCDVAMAAREILPGEAAEIAAKGLGDVRQPASEHVIALDGIAAIVHPNNPVRVLDRPKLAGIFTGETTDWSAVGGAPGPITVLGHEEGTGTVDVLRSLLLDGRALAPSARRLTDNDKIVAGVAGAPDAIGFVGLAFVRNTRALAISDRGVRPMLPTYFTVSTEAYLLSRRLFLYTPSTAPPLALELVNHVVSPAGQEAIRAAGFVALDVTLKSTEPCDRCPAAYAKTTKNARRLSLDFRFRPGTHELDARAARDIDRVVQFMRGRSSAKILLLGFSEATRDARADRKRSRAFAEAIDRELATRGLRASVIDGFGGEMPIVSGDDEAAHARNRRVEIWLESDAP